MARQEITDAIEITAKISDGDWTGLIMLQSMKGADDYHAAVLNNVLLRLQIEKKFTDTLILDRKIYLAMLVRYFGIMPLNNGLYFMNEADAKAFVGQYKELMKSNCSLQGEEGEKIRILETKLILDEEVEQYE
jgi:hypothetical protein